MQSEHKAGYVLRNIMRTPLLVTYEFAMQSSPPLQSPQSRKNCVKQDRMSEIVTH
jgi:hypothetical protein